MTTSHPHSLHNQISQIETNLQKIESEDIEFEKSLEIYQNTVAQAKTILETLSIHHASLSVLQAESQQLIEHTLSHE
jgi:exonuclease VII small subunit